MANPNLKRRIERLEAALAASKREKHLPVGFFLRTDRLPAGTPIPDGRHIVEDVHSTLKAENHPAPGLTFLSGYLAERITGDSDDRGRYAAVPEAGDGPKML